MVKIPQWCWTLVGCVIYTLIAAFGANHFSDILENFLLILAYYAAPYTIIVLVEHIVFRNHGKNYNLEDWNDQRNLPIGAAAVGSLFIGFGVAMVGMNQVWFVGPVAKQIGAYGGDIGFELAIGVSFISYLALRPIERRIFGR